MRSVSEILRTYNFVNTPEGRRNTVRFFAGVVVLVAGGFMVYIVAFGGLEGGDPAMQGAQQGDDPYQLSATRLSGSEWYIGYPVELYDADHRDGYSVSALNAKLAEWEDDYSVWIRSIDPVTSQDEHNVLLGYHVTLAPAGLSSPA